MAFLFPRYRSANDFLDHDTRSIIASLDLLLFNLFSIDPTPRGLVWMTVLTFPEPFFFLFINDDFILKAVFMYMAFRYLFFFFFLLLQSHCERSFFGWCFLSDNINDFHFFIIIVVVVFDAMNLFLFAMKLYTHIHTYTHNIIDRQMNLFFFFSFFIFRYHW